MKIAMICEGSCGAKSIGESLTCGNASAVEAIIICCNSMGHTIVVYPGDCGTSLDGI